MFSQVIPFQLIQTVILTYLNFSTTLLLRRFYIHFIGVRIESSILLYTLMTSSSTFRETILARDDLESVVLPLLRAVHGHHSVAPMPSSHLYVVMILLLMFSQDISYSEGAFKRMNVQVSI